MFYGNKSNLLQYATKLLQGKVNILKNDAGLCLIGNKDYQYQPAPFTALLACFSLLDFLSALYNGNASHSATITNNFKTLLREYFSYSDDQGELILSIYRHKLVHLFQPGTVIEYKGHTYSWRIHNSEPSMHLKIWSNKGSLINPASCIRIKLEYVFSISIRDLIEEIVNAASNYLKDLEVKPELQANFEKALKQIYCLS